MWPDAALRAAIAAWRDACTWPAGAAVVATPKLHMTLHFIGEVAADRLPAIVQGLRVPLQPFELALDRCVAWPRGLVVLQPSETPAALLALHAACADVLRSLELPVQRRPFRAHVTLARGAAGASLQQRTEPLRWPAGELALVRSHPGPLGYEVLSRIGGSRATSTRQRDSRPRPCHTAKPASTQAEATLTRRRQRASKRSRSRPTTALSSSHHSAEPSSTPLIMVHGELTVSAPGQRAEHGNERQDRGRVAQRQHEGAGKRAQQVGAAGGLRGALGHRRTPDRPRQPQQERAAAQHQRHAARR